MQFTLDNKTNKFIIKTIFIVFIIIFGLTALVSILMVIFPFAFADVDPGLKNKFINATIIEVAIGITSLFGFIFLGKKKNNGGFNKKLEFIDQISGHWWSPNVNENQVGVVQFVMDKKLLSVKMIGRSYTPDGHKARTWESIFSSVEESNSSIQYYWEGRHWEKDGSVHESAGNFEGKGKIVFKMDGVEFNLADEVFTDFSSDGQFNKISHSTLRKCSNTEVKIITSGNKIKLGKLILEQLKKEY